MSDEQLYVTSNVTGKFAAEIPDNIVHYLILTTFGILLCGLMSAIIAVELGLLVWRLW